MSHREHGDYGDERLTVSPAAPRTPLSSPRGGPAPWDPFGHPLPADRHGASLPLLRFVVVSLVVFTVISIGVSVMRISQYTARRGLDLSSVRSVSELQRRRAEREKSGPAFTVVPRQFPVRNDDLTPLQTIALLRMASSTMCRGMAINMLGDVQDKPALSDYRRLVELKMAAEPAEDSRWHTITVHGETEARIIAQIEARQRGIHLLVEGSNFGAQASYRCTCGEWSASYQRGTFTASNASLGFQRHLMKIDAQRRGETG